MSPRDRRALALGSIVVVAAWTTLRGVPKGLGALHQLQESVAQRANLLARAQSRLALLPRLTDSIQALAGVADSLSATLLVGEDTETARIDLMSRVRGTVEGCPITIRGFSPAQAVDSTGPLASASVVVVIESDTRGLLDSVRQLERDPALAIDSLQVEAGDPDDEAEAMEYLSTRIAVSGWFRPGDSSSGPDSTAGADE